MNKNNTVEETASRASTDRTQTITASDFDDRLLHAQGPVAVEFMSCGCGHCRIIEPVLQKVAESVYSAVAEVLRPLPNTQWIAQYMPVTIFGPFQSLLDVAYAVLADVRPLLGCEGRGTPSVCLRLLHWVTQRAKTIWVWSRPLSPSARFSPRQRKPSDSGERNND